MKSIRKFTSEELSRVLSDHASNNLERGGYFSNNMLNWDTIDRHCRPCMYQSAFNGNLLDRTDDISVKAMDCFDSEYLSIWTAEQFIEKMREWGVL